MELAILGVVFLIIINAATVVCLLENRSIIWWVLFGLGWTIGGYFGYHHAGAEYSHRPDMKIYGYPFPGVVLILEGEKGKEHWVDYVSPFPLGIIAANFLIYLSPVTLLLGPILWHRTLKNRDPPGVKEP